MDQVNVLAVDVPRDLERNWGWFLTLGVCLCALGILGIVYSITATIASMYFFGGLLVVASATECVNAVLVGKWSGFFLHLLGALLFGVTGTLLLTYPVTSAEGITVLMAAFFTVGGTFEVIAPLFMNLPGTGWHVVNGAISVLFGIFVFAQWPFSGVWVIGTFVGISLLFRGLSSTAFAVGLRLTAYGSTSQTSPNISR
jgi:uncharacterized membrane protein HdeD (DUF308 family)